MATTYHRNQTAPKAVGTPSAGRPSEAQLKRLMLESLRGDTRAYTALLQAVRPLLSSFYNRRMRDHAADAEDLVQETLTAMYSRRGSYDGKRPFTPWMFAIARHKLVDHFRARRNHQPIDELSDILRVEGFEAASNARRDVHRLLDLLPKKQARAIRQTRLHGLSIAEAAAAAGIGLSDVKVSIHRGLKALAMRVALEPA